MSKAFDDARRWARETHEILENPSQDFDADSQTVVSGHDFQAARDACERALDALRKLAPNGS